MLETALTQPLDGLTVMQEIRFKLSTICLAPHVHDSYPILRLAPI